EYGLITEPVFVAIIFGAVVSSVILGPWLGYSIKKRREVSVLEYFTSRGIIADLKNTDKNTVIRELCGLAANQDEMPDADSLYESVIQRENEMGTAMEEGIAVPHARMKFLARPVVVFGRSAAGIEWDSPDGKPAHFIFLILTPYGDDQTQIQILQLIARTLSEEKIRRAIMEAGTDDAIWQTLRRALTPVNILRK
ncbi:MAG: PTS sugar transporter subunit IIA, partial [Candidatus Omnitrophota bacterium]